jgi:hypothetical protein
VAKKRHGGELRGNVHDRAARKRKLLLVFGNGVIVACIHRCGTILDYATVQADRIDPEGRYTWDNVQPSCGPCNKARGRNTAWKYA